ncbi:hypothetical protein ES332_D02G287100v1 [Gossypium tomentosum]|uniref:Uncharacterized protein n=1 Tax=Gossypium tomentosum TaxID=34277 RepID=A0A5D2M305_GOSTO|nr:hypothetical protein ES332_D02G287100v1 [Gossypium tomentosum]
MEMTRRPRPPTESRMGTLFTTTRIQSGTCCYRPWLFR